MKTSISYSLVAAAMACGLVQAQTTAYTTPVGYTTAAISGAFGVGNPKNNVIAPNLRNTASFAGTVQSVSGDVVTLNLAALPVGVGGFGNISASFPSIGTVYSSYLEAADGYWAQIASNTATTVTLEAGVASNFTVGEAVTIRKHVTVAQYFGPTNETGLLPDNVNYDPGAADNITFIDEVNGGTNLVFSNNINGGTWTTGSYEEAKDFPIYPDQALQVLRRAVGNLNLVQSGEVDANPRQIGISTGVQVRPYVIPVTVTLDNLGLYTGNPATGVVGTATGDAGAVDIVSVLIDGAVAQYAYSEIDLGSGIGWYLSDFSGPAPALPAGAGIIVNRSNPTNSAPFVWTIPAATIGN